VIKKQVGVSNWYRQIEQPAPERNLHHAENANNDKVRVNVFWKLLSRIAQELFELG
jgi:hypothetical protein